MHAPYPNLLRYLEETESALVLDLVEGDNLALWELTVDNPDGTETLSLDGDELLIFHGLDPAAVLAEAECWFAAREQGRMTP